MLKNTKAENILFLDIETVSEVPEFDKLSPEKQKLWEKKSSFLRKEEETPSELYHRAGIYAEFGKIVCISVGLIHVKSGEMHLRLKSFFGDDEKSILSEFGGLLEKLSKNKDINLCGHNAREFDFPYLARRTLINGLKLPQLLNVAGKKPWEVPFLDTIELWRFGDYKNYTSLDLLANLFEIPTPKGDMDGSMVSDTYWKEKDLQRIAVYCEKDVRTVVQLFLRLQGKSLIKDELIESTTSF